MTPDFDKAWDYENNFYLTCDATRLGKFSAHLELYKKILELPGCIAEFGVFKGASFSRLCIFRELFESAATRSILGFDTFGTFPKASGKDHNQKLDTFLREAGNQSIGQEALEASLKQRGLDKNVTLVKGDICDTLPEYLNAHPQTRFALVNMDVDIYEPSKVILKHVWERIVHGGILILDNYSVFSGETEAVEEVLGKHVEIRKFPFAMTPYYVVRA